MDIERRFSARNNTRTLRWGEYRVWRYGESAVVRSRTQADRLVGYAQRVDADAHAVDRNGNRA